LPLSFGRRSSWRRLPLRWAVITGVAVAAGIACFAAGGIAAAVTAAAVVAVALHELLA